MEKVEDPEEFDTTEKSYEEGELPPIILRPDFVESQGEIIDISPSAPKVLPELSDFEVHYGVPDFIYPWRTLPEKFHGGGAWEEFLEGIVLQKLDPRVQLWSRDKAIECRRAWRVVAATVNCASASLRDRMTSGAFYCCQYFRAIAYTRLDILDPDGKPVHKYLDSRPVGQRPETE